MLVIVRAMEARDLAAVADLFAATYPAAHEQGLRYDVAQLRSELERPIARCLVLEQDAQTLAVIIVWLVADEAELMNIAVHPNARGKGFGKQLLRASLAQIREGGGTRMHLEVREDNLAACALYGGFGFVEVRRRSTYYADGASGIEMMWVDDPT
jgi:[ribosomal protein S18]-alanine N-acetyltransferase